MPRQDDNLTYHERRIVLLQDVEATVSGVCGHVYTQSPFVDRRSCSIDVGLVKCGSDERFGVKPASEVDSAIVKVVGNGIRSGHMRGVDAD